MICKSILLEGYKDGPILIHLQVGMSVVTISIRSMDDWCIVWDCLV